MSSKLFRNERVQLATSLGALVMLFSPRVTLAEEVPQPLPLQDIVTRDLQKVASGFVELYQKTPWTDRVAWGSLAACAVLAVLTILERSWSLRSRKVMPRRFVHRLEERLEEGRLDRSKMVDMCELNPSAVARVAGSVVSRWGRPSIDMERAMLNSVRVESDELRRNIPTLKRIAILAPLLGLLGSLMMIGRLLQIQDPQIVSQTWTKLLGQGLLPVTFGVLIAVLSLIAYDGLSLRVAKYTSRFEQMGSRLLDQIALASVTSESRMMMIEPPGMTRHHLGAAPRREKSFERDVYEDDRPRAPRRRKPLEPIDLDDLDD